MSWIENEEVNFQRMAFRRKAVFFCCCGVVYFVFGFSGTENHTSLPKEDNLVLARKLNLQTDGDGTSPCLRAAPHLDYSSEDIHSADTAALGWPDKKQSKNHRSFSVRRA